MVGACETMGSDDEPTPFGAADPFRRNCNRTLFLAFPALAQQDQAPAQQPPSSQQQSHQGRAGKDDKNKNQSEQSGTSKDRLFFTLPNFLTVENAGQIPPLTSGQKFKVVARSSFDYVEFPWYGFLSAISQAENSEA